MNDDLNFKIQLMYAELGKSQETSLENLSATVKVSDQSIEFRQDFRGGLSDVELGTYAYALINSIAFLRDQLQEWAVHNGHTRAQIDDVMNKYDAILIMRDLSENHKHVYKPHGSSKSGKHPKLVNINRVLRLTTKPEKGSGVGVTVNSDGTLRILGDGSAKAITTGEVVDNNGNRIGDLYDLATEAVEGWEEIFREFALKIGS